MKIALTLCILLSALMINAQSPIVGTWNTGKDNTKIEITEANGVCQGKIISSEGTKAKIGSQLIKDVKSVGGEWKGKLYNAKKKKWYDAVLNKVDDELHITVDAGLVSKTVKWKKG